jgi:uncharacterized protein YqiB (DUF1249 family)
MMDRLKSRYIVDLPKHLAVCEGNYHRLLQLMPNLQKDPNQVITKSQQGQDDASSQQWQYSMSGFNDDFKNKGLELSIVVSEIAKYTTMLNVRVTPSALSSGDKDIVENINANADNNLLATLVSYSLDIRLYHDAQLAEVVSSVGCRQLAARNDYPNQKMHQCDEKSQLNQFLGELISFCLIKGRVAYNIVSA